MSRTAVATRAFLVVFAGAALATGAAGSPRRCAKPSPVNAQPVAGSSFTGERISLDLKDADLKDVLATFAKLARVNIAIDPGVKGSVTLRLHDVPWDQALEVILRINGLGYVLEGNVLRVGEPRNLIPVRPPE
jgi:type II secretory pathway component HofQ